MFDNNKIQICGNELVGFREDNSSIYAALPANLKVSNTGYFFNDLPGLDFEIIEAVLSADAINAETYLQDVYDAELQNIVARFIETQKSKLQAKELLSNQNFVTGVAKFSDKVLQKARFVGYVIEPHSSNNLQSTITSIGVQVTSTQATPLKIFLYETSQKSAIATFDFAITKEDSLDWKAVTDFIVNYQSEDGGSGQVFYLGYYEADTSNPQAFQLQSEAIKMEFSCGCAGSPSTMWGKYMGISPIEINNEDLNPNGSTYDIPTPDNITGNITQQTYGLYAKVNVKCDLTHLICDNITMFSKPLQHAVAIRLLMDAFATKQINSIADSKADMSKNFAMHYQGILNGHTTEEGVHVKGLMELLTLDFAGLDRYCSPCNPRDLSFANLIRS